MTSGFDQLERELRAAEARLKQQPSTDRRKRRSGTVRYLTLALSLVVPVAIAVGALTLLHPSTHTVVNGRYPGAYSDPEGWSVAYPGTMRLERSTSGPGEVTFSEVTVANFRPSTGVVTHHSRNGGSIRVEPPVAPNGTFPPDGVAFRIVSLEGGPGQIPTVPDSRFPLNIATFERSRLPHGVKYNADTGETTATSGYERLPPSTDQQIEANGARFTVIAWIGPLATRTLRAELERVINSLQFDPLRPNTEVNDLTVLQQANQYPVGSFTLVHARGAICDGNAGRCHSGQAPFYLIRAPGRLRQPDLIQPCPQAGTCISPGAFYALGWTDQAIDGGYTSSCDLRLDRRDEQFYCTNSAARWDRVGRVIRRPAGARISDPLGFSFAKIAWDGHVVFAAGEIGSPPRAPALRLLWPQWHPNR